MYLSHLKATLVEAVKAQFDQDYPNEQFRGIHTSIEYPVDAQNYPGIWVDYEDTQSLQIAGVRHREFGPSSADGSSRRRYTRWKFGGYASFTVVAMSSLERDLLFDELVRVMAFGSGVDSVNEFRAYIEHNDLIAVNFDFDQIEVRGNAAGPGTPWGTDEIVYEKTLSMECFGEFVSDGSTQSLVPLSQVRVLPQAQGEANPSPGPGDPGSEVPYSGDLSVWQ